MSPASLRLCQARGFKVSTMAMERGEWAAVLRALLTRDYWARRCATAPAYTWYLQRLKATIDAARLATGSDRVDLVGVWTWGWDLGFRASSDF